MIEVAIIACKRLGGVVKELPVEDKESHRITTEWRLPELTPENRITEATLYGINTAGQLICYNDIPQFKAADVIRIRLYSVAGEDEELMLERSFELNTVWCDGCAAAGVDKFQVGEGGSSCRICGKRFSDIPRVGEPA